MERKAILVVDDEELIRESLVEFFEDDFDVEGAGSGEEALEILERRNFDLVISDIRMPGIDGFEVIRVIREKYPRTKTALITAYDVDDYIKLAKEKQITNIIVKETPFNFDELGQTSHNLLTGEFFGIHRYLDYDAKIEQLTIQETEAIQLTIGKIVDFFRGITNDEEIFEVCDLILDELLHNAIVHAPRDQDGKPKYDRTAQVVLADEEIVHVAFGYDQRKLGFAVIDNYGTLENSTVLDLLDRHISGSGTRDYQGRGLFISRSLTDRFIINIHRGVKTEIICLIYFTGDHDYVKPLCINEI
ncbi:response regulator [candidate division CSSED10-310 bacterium]|uniref:Response regulator n=1 Tax=candidate division CSSED10-310 bacterium TaxID=2855610 RepID=A0ABV6YY90_UNCC1